MKAGSGDARPYEQTVAVVVEEVLLAEGVSELLTTGRGAERIMTAMLNPSNGLTHTVARIMKNIASSNLILGELNSSEPYEFSTQVAQKACRLGDVPPNGLLTRRAASPTTSHRMCLAH